MGGDEHGNGNTHRADGTVKRATIEYFDKHNRTYKYPLKKPFGYEWDGEGFAVVPHEAEAVMLMFKSYADGWKIADISRELEGKGYHSYKGKLSRRVLAIAAKEIQRERLTGFIKTLEGPR